MSVIKIQSKEDLEKEFIELAHEVNRMRVWQRYWHEHFGGAAKARRVEWEKKVDDRLRRLGLDEIDHTKPVKIVKE